MEVLTIGHSNHGPDKFLSLLKQHSVTMIIDVRSKPTSRFPHFARDNLIRLVRSNEIDYRYGGNVLGGMGNIWGVIAGAVLLSFMPELLRYTVEPAQKALFGKMLVDPEVLRMLIFGLALVLTMRFRPAGLWPETRHRRELDADRK